MEALDKYEAARNEVFAHVGYVEDWRILPLEDCRECLWRLDGEGPGDVHYADTVEELESGNGNCYSAEIYTQRHLPKWVYRGAKYTMIVIDTHCDGNQFLAIFTNANERP